MKIVKLSPVDARTWRQNQLVLLNAEGEFVRNVTAGEAKALSELTKKAKHGRKDVSATLLVEGKKVVLTVKPTVVQRTVQISQLVDGLRVVSGRDHFTKQVLAVHGECQLRTHTGQFMKTIVDPSKPRPMRSRGGDARAPHPDACQCKPWGEKHEGRHHKVCSWNATAPLDQRALESGAEPSGVLEMIEDAPEAVAGHVIGKPSLLSPASLTTKVDTSKARPSGGVIGKPSILGGNAVSGAPSPVATPAVTAPAPAVKKTVWSPSECPNECSAWAKVEGSVDGEHHPICQWKEGWEASRVGAAETMHLVSLSSGGVSREATVAEAAEAAEKGYVVIGSEQFAVMPESEVKKSA